MRSALKFSGSPLRCLVTGGSRGIGAGISARLKEAGWIVEAPPRSVLNLADPDSVGDFLSENIEYDGVVLNAGINPVGATSHFSREGFAHVMEVNLASNFQILGALLPNMAEKGFGRVVALSSLYSSRARVGRAIYSASKSGIESLVRNCAVEFGRSGVIANAVAPGFIDTELTRRNNSPEAIEMFASRIPTGRLGSIPEIARAVEFLISPENSYINGHTLVVDGGWSCT